MRYIYYCVLAILCIGLVSACVVEEESVGSVDGQLVHKVFDATFEDSDMTTKTVLDETVGEDGFRGLLWDSGDEIGVAGYGGYYQKFTNVLVEPSANGVFDGKIEQTSLYYAIYPFTASQRHSTSVSVTVPTSQTYRVNSFDRNMAPMVGKGNDGERLHFMNLCGVLAVQLTGSEKVKSIVFETKNGEKVSGVCSVDPDYVDYPVLDTSTATETYVTLDCGEGVQLSGEATPFHIVLPPGTYNGFTLYITTADGKFMKKETSKTLTIKRSIVTKAASFDFENNMTDITNLSEHGHSNCYVVPEAGVYSFDADIIGNGEFGIIEGAGFHTSNPTISPVSVDLLWEDRPGLVRVYALDPATGKVKLITNGKEGNALIAVKDADNTILWSWHIWMTDQPSDQNYENGALGSFIMLDRNIGAIRADRGTGDEWMESKGLYYQWGRKDPFAPGMFTNHSGQFTAAESLKYPTEFGTSSNWTSETQVNFWNAGKKTIYDPCPVGYRVPVEDVWYGFSSDGNSNLVTESQVSSTTYDNGWSFYRNSSSETAWYPVTGYYYGTNSYSNSSYGYYWSADKNGGGNPYYVSFSSGGYVFQNETTNTRNACNIRCLKDEDHVDISTHVSFKPVEFSEVSTSSVKLSSGYKEGSAVTIVEKGFAYDKSADFSNETRVAVESDGRDFLCTLTDLDNATRYYVRAYAETVIGNETVMFYSDAVTFGTRYSDDVASLSENGTANCYIVSYPGTYSFNCTVKGNSTESVGVPASAEVIWETANLTEDISVGEIITSTQLIGDVLVFDTTGKHGNAVIAVVDEAGTVLWSWHIWVTDYDPESTAQTYHSGAVMMDRNLGALNAERDDVLSWGLFYQQGRKDPFVGCGSISGRTFATTAPSGKIQYQSGGDNDTAVQKPWLTLGSYDFTWSDTKSMTDPCPIGWKVPSSSAWSGFSSGYRTSTTYGVVYGAPNSTPDAYYPYTGDTQMGSQSLRNPGNSNSYLWMTDSGYAYYFWGPTTTSRSKYDENPVRCMKDE